MLPVAQLSAPTAESKPKAEIMEMPMQPMQKTQPVQKMQKEKEIPANNTVFINDDDEVEETSAEFISIKKSWLRNLAAACIAIIVFFTISTPLGAPTMQKSQIDTGMLNRIMPKDIDQV